MNTQIYKFNSNTLLLLFFSTLLALIATVNVSAATRNPAADFDGDGKTDISVFRPSNGYWYISNSSGGFSFLQWGAFGDYPIAGDYDGDGKTDLAVYRNSQSIKGRSNFDITWYILRSSDNTFSATNFGRNGNLVGGLPTPADYDGDGKTDFTIWQTSDVVTAPGNFIIEQSSTKTVITKQWGTGADKRVPADYDGDGKADLAVYRYQSFPDSTEVGKWYIQQSSNGETRTEHFGLQNDIPVQADYDGDGKADIAVWRPSDGYWYWLSSRDKSFNSIQFGLSADRPVPGDYDGDGKTDFAVFRPSNGTWYIQQSTKGFRAEQFGLATDIPIPHFIR